MKVLVACEESQRVCMAFREKGHEAYSCDIIECSGGHPEWHIQGDVLNVLNPEQTFEGEKKGIEFFTSDGELHSFVGKWDLIIAHPPCTRLCTTSQRWLYFGDKEYRSKKISEQQKAIVFFMQIALADCHKIAIENPQGIMSSAFRKPDCTYNPYDFEGETECKKTCLWLKGLNPLKPTRKEPLPKEERTQGIFRSHFDGKVIGWNDPECARMRSVTPLGVAAAMAEQWG
jgi:hypothetical protein